MERGVQCKERREQVVLESAGAFAQIFGCMIGVEQLEKSLLRVESGRDECLGFDALACGQLESGGAAVANQNGAELDAGANLAAMLADIFDERFGQPRRSADAHLSL